MTQTIVVLVLVSLFCAHICAHEGIRAGGETRHTKVLHPDEPRFWASRDVACSSCTCTTIWAATTYDETNGVIPQTIKDAIEYAKCLWSCIIPKATHPGGIRLNVITTSVGGNLLAFAGPSFSISGNTLVLCPLNPAVCGFLASDIDLNIDPTTNYYTNCDGAAQGTGKIDLVSVLMHELGHGLGFTGFASDNNAAYNLFCTFDRQITVTGSSPARPWNTLPPGANADAAAVSNALTFQGQSFTNGKLFAPTTYQDGSSIYHWDENTYAQGNINSLMSPVINFEEVVHFPGPLTCDVLKTIGFTVDVTKCCSTPSPAAASVSSTISTSSTTSRSTTTTPTLTASSTTSGSTTTTPTLTASTTTSPSNTGTRGASAPPTGSGTGTPSITRSPSNTGTRGASAPPTGSGTGTPSITSSPSSTGTRAAASPSRTGTPSGTGSRTPSGTGSSGASPSRTGTPSRTSSRTPSGTGAAASPSRTGTPSRTSSRTPSGTGTIGAGVSASRTASRSSTTTRSSSTTPSSPGSPSGSTSRSSTRSVTSSRTGTGSSTNTANAPSKTRTPSSSAAATGTPTTTRGFTQSGTSTVSASASRTPSKSDSSSRTSTASRTSNFSASGTSSPDPTKVSFSNTPTPSARSQKSFSVPGNALSVSVTIQVDCSISSCAGDVFAARRAIAEYLGVSISNVQITFIVSNDGTTLATLTVCGSSSDIESLLTGIDQNQITDLGLSAAIFSDPVYYDACVLDDETQSFTTLYTSNAVALRFGAGLMCALFLLFQVM